MPLEKFRKLMLILSICYKGLMFSEILQLVPFSLLFILKAIINLQKLTKKTD